LTGTPVAVLIVIRPGIEVKAIEGDALFPDGDFNEAGAHLGIEPIAVHAEIGRRISKPYEARRIFILPTHREGHEKQRSIFRARIGASARSLRKNG
jgi:hypothetical protein